MHSVKQKKFGGNLEVQEMCFYIDPQHQANPPQPLDSSPVYIQKRPTMRVYALRFDGHPMSADTWTRQKDLLENLLIGKPHHDAEYYTNGFDSPMKIINRRNEVWIQELEPAKPVVAAVEAEEEPEPEPEHKPIQEVLQTKEQKQEKEQPVQKQPAKKQPVQKEQEQQEQEQPAEE